MKINADFSERVRLDTEEMAWTPSPMAGVDRRPLDRIGGEVARATSIVRYAKGSAFSAHTHGGGEEFIVLDGVFQDEHGDYPKGTYVRNPPGTSHTPGSAPGCTILVKLWQFDQDDQVPVRTAMDEAPAEEDPARPGVTVTPLFENAEESVAMERLAPGAAAAWAVDGGAELLILSGNGSEGGARIERGTWLRFPDGDALSLIAGPDGLTYWIKTGHLRHIRVPGGAADG
ncbi:cupin domain-containing protein [Ovoidimarina sediminis]|uniref:cupin domain-containing protein n=1 Tax=Ovoidimarina sediminis TaxID=3079856 RepID=UPI00290EDA8B|nr:cupin domain-containing protein [Rhodophyticola sp. MJ-SS7]MDU8946508.1 cupin domain-containing protein [Rhodophyticola sp. MJ-SS7]